MSNLKHISTALEDAIIDILVRQMINPNNKQFYIKSLTLGKIKAHLDFINDKAYTPLFFKATELAKLVTSEQDSVEYSTEESGFVQNEIKQIRQTCPECGCKDYILGLVCPNCDYED